MLWGVSACETMPPGSALSQSIAVPPSGWVSLHVDSDVPLSTYLIDEQGWKRYSDRDSHGNKILGLACFGGFKHQKEHYAKAKIPHGTDLVFLIIVNGEKSAADVVFSLMPLSAAPRSANLDNGPKRKRS